MLTSVVLTYDVNAAYDDYIAFIGMYATLYQSVAGKRVGVWRRTCIDNSPRTRAGRSLTMTGQLR